MTEQCKWCSKQQHSRGLCMTHYRRATRIVADGVTWEAVLAGSEPDARERGRPPAVGGPVWLAEQYDRLANDVAKAIVLIDSGDFTGAKRVLIGENLANDLLTAGWQDAGGSAEHSAEKIRVDDNRLS